MMIEKITSLFKTYPFIVAAYQYGSTVRGQEGPLSDLDIAILVDEQQAPTGVELLRIEMLLAYEVQKQLGIPEVDLITLNHQRLTMQQTNHNIHTLGFDFLKYPAFLRSG